MNKRLICCLALATSAGLASGDFREPSELTEALADIDGVCQSIDEETPSAEDILDELIAYLEDRV